MVPKRCLKAFCRAPRVTGRLLHFFFLYTLKLRGPMNTKTQSLIHKKAHALQKRCHLVPEEVVFILQRSSSPSNSLALALIER